MRFIVLVTNSIEDKLLFLLGHVRFLSETLAAIHLILILISWFWWLLFAIWILFFTKITCFLNKPFYNFRIFNAQNQNINIEVRDEDTVREVGNHIISEEAGQEEHPPV